MKGTIATGPMSQGKRGKKIVNNIRYNLDSLYTIGHVIR
jgi:hypothetical protein